MGGRVREAGAWRRRWCGLTLLLWALLAFSAARAEGLAQHDPNLPIEITADRLVVEQNQERAIFSGNVQAVQGNLSLRAQRLLVYYHLAGEEKAETQAVRRIEAEGKVVISSPNENATAERAVYDVREGRIRLEGKVVLTSGENVIEGERLEIDLAARTAVVSASADKTGGRVRALFIPAGRAEAKP